MSKNKVIPVKEFLSSLKDWHKRLSEEHNLMLTDTDKRDMLSRSLEEKDHERALLSVLAIFKSNRSEGYTQGQLDAIQILIDKAEEAMKEDNNGSN